jgi:release factor glutamine methyltransferase
MKPNDEAQPDVAAVLERGVTQFMGLELFVEAGALIPRVETELLGREAVRLARDAANAPIVIDVCCGAGNLACAIASCVATAHVWAADLTAPCAALARRNVDKLGLAGRVRVFQGDLFAPLTDEGLEARADLITCNPPYISTARVESEQSERFAGEPREAFDGGPYGLTIHQRVMKEAQRFLKPGGSLLFEFGLGQERQMNALFARAKAYDEVRFLHNESGAPRVAVARFRHVA